MAPCGRIATFRGPCCLLLEKLRGRDYEDLGVDRSNGSKGNRVGVWTGFMWLSIGTSGGLL